MKTIEEMIPKLFKHYKDRVKKIYYGIDANFKELNERLKIIEKKLKIG